MKAAVSHRFLTCLLLILITAKPGGAPFHSISLNAPLHFSHNKGNKIYCVKNTIWIDLPFAR